MMYNDVDNDLPPFNDTIDGEEIFLFSNAKTSSNGPSFLHEDDDEHLRHQHNVVAGASNHLSVDVDELLLNSNFLEQPNCDQSEDPLFWNCKDIADDHLNEFLPQNQLGLSNNGNGNASSNNVNHNNNNIHLINNNNNNINNCNIALAQQNQVALNQQHSQTIIPAHYLQSQQQQQQQQLAQQAVAIQQTIRLHHDSTQQHQLQLQPQPQQQQQVVTTLQQHSALIQHAPNQSQVIQHDSQQTKWITLIQSDDQYQTFGVPQAQFFEKVPQALVQPSNLGPTSTTAQTSLSNLAQVNEQPILVHQQQMQRQQPQQQQQQLQTQPQQQQIQQPILLQQIQPLEQSIISIPPYQQLLPEQKPKSSVSTTNTALKKDAPTKQKPKEKQTRLDCPYCKRSFSKNFDLQQHMRCHTGEKPFQCIVCGRGFAQKSNVKKHMQAHKVWPEGPNNPSMPSMSHGSARSRNNSASSSVSTPRDDECMQENESLQVNDNVNNDGISIGLSNDRKNDGNDIFAENRYSCSYCQFNGRTYFELKSHLTIHKREKVFKCIVSSCGKTFSGGDLQGFLDHVTSHKDLIYHCHLCSGQFYSLDEFGEHQKNHSNAQIKKTSQQSQGHNNHQQGSLTVLNPQNNGASLRQQNQQVVPTQLQPQQNQRQYNQQQAPTQQSNNQKNSRLFSNQAPKKNQKYFRCSKCMNRYTTQSALDHHLSISTHNFPCTECNKVFMCERYLRRHLNTHTAVQHVCTYCDKQFKTAAYLKMHSVVHTGEKPFRCNLCEAAFNRRDKLNRHKLTHETVKKYKCPLKPHIGCTKEFNRPDKLKAHVLTHSGHRPHPCDACSRTFSRLSRLREHKKLHHENVGDSNISINNHSPESQNNSGGASNNNIMTTTTSATPTTTSSSNYITISSRGSVEAQDVKQEVSCVSTQVVAIEIDSNTRANSSEVVMS